MKYSRLIALLAAVLLLALLGSPAAAGQDGDSSGTSFKADLNGFEEVPANSTRGRGEFRANISPHDTSIAFELSYEGLEGAVTTAAHIHLGQRAAIGGVSVFLCGGGGRPACTPTSGEFSGTITASDVIGPAGQGITTGEFAELLNAMRKGMTYANVHTTGPTGSNFPGGEIRGQIEPADDDDEGDGKHDD